MPRRIVPAEAHVLLRSRSQLLSEGLSPRSLSRAVHDGLIHSVRRGWYVDAEQWSDLWAEARHLVHTVAVLRDASSDAVAASVSAAVVHGLPLYRIAPKRVHLITAAPDRISSCPDVLRHVGPLADTEVTTVEGIRCTTLARTVFDLLRTLPSEAAVAVADAAERIAALRGRAWDQAARAAWRDGMGERVARGAGARGIRQARWVTDFADGAAQLPGESVSRLQLVRIGFGVPRLQVPVPDPFGGLYFVDFGLDDANAFGEFDGEGKYFDPTLRGAVSAEQALLAEKQREDWIRGTTQRRYGRWQYEHIRTWTHLGARLASFGIRPPP